MNKLKNLKLGKVGGFAIESLLALILVVFTAAIVFFLVQSGTLEVDDVSSTDIYGSSSLLQTEFLPIASGGTLVASEIMFCGEDQVSTICFEEREEFYLGEEVHFSFEVMSSAKYGKIELRENYRLIGPDGTTLLEVNEEDDLVYEAVADESVEQVFFHDYFILGNDAMAGEYTLDIVMRNTLISKEVTLKKKITVLP